MWKGKVAHIYISLAVGGVRDMIGQTEECGAIQSGGLVCGGKLSNCPPTFEMHSDSCTCLRPAFLISCIVLESDRSWLIIHLNFVHIVMHSV